MGPPPHASVFHLISPQTCGTHDRDGYRVSEHRLTAPTFRTNSGPSASELILCPPSSSSVNQGLHAYLLLQTPPGSEVCWLDRRVIQAWVTGIGDRSVAFSTCCPTSTALASNSQEATGVQTLSFCLSSHLFFQCLTDQELTYKIHQNPVVFLMEPNTPSLPGTRYNPPHLWTRLLYSAPFALLSACTHRSMGE